MSWPRAFWPPQASNEAEGTGPELELRKIRREGFSYRRICVLLAGVGFAHATLIVVKVRSNIVLLVAHAKRELHDGSGLRIYSQSFASVRSRPRPHRPKSC